MPFVAIWMIVRLSLIQLGRRNLCVNLWAEAHGQRLLYPIHAIEPQARGPGTKGCGHWTTHRRPIISVAAAQLALDGFARARRLMMLELVCLTEPVILTNLWIQSAVN